MRVLVVYEYVPEDTRLYILDLDGDDLAMARKAHGVYVNVSKNDAAALRLDKFLEDKQPLKIKAGQPFEMDGIELMIHSGFMI